MDLLRSTGQTRVSAVDRQLRQRRGDGGVSACSLVANDRASVCVACLFADGSRCCPCLSARCDPALSTGQACGRHRVGAGSTDGTLQWGASTTLGWARPVTTLRGSSSATARSGGSLSQPLAASLDNAAVSAAPAMQRARSIADAARRRGAAVQPRWMASSTRAAAASASSSPPLLLSLSLHRYPPAVQTASHASAADSHRQRRLARLEPPAIVANRPQIAVGSVLLDKQRREAEDACIESLRRQKQRPQSSRSQFQSATSAANKTADAAAIDAISEYHTHMLLKIVRYRRTDAESTTASARASADWTPAGSAGEYDVSVATRVLSAADSLHTLTSTVSSLLSSSAAGGPRATVDSVRSVSSFSRFLSRLRGKPPRDSAFTQTIDSARSIASLFVTPLTIKQSAAAAATAAALDPPGPIALQLRPADAGVSGSVSPLPRTLLLNHDGLVHSGALPRFVLMRRLRLMIVVFLGSFLLLGLGSSLSNRWLHDAQVESDRRTRLERQHALAEMHAQKRREDKRAVVARGGPEMDELRNKKEALRAKMEEAERLREEAEQRKDGDAAAPNADKR